MSVPSPLSISQVWLKIRAFNLLDSVKQLLGSIRITIQESLSDNSIYRGSKINLWNDLPILS